MLTSSAAPPIAASVAMSAVSKMKRRPPHRESPPESPVVVFSALIRFKNGGVNNHGQCMCPTDLEQPTHTVDPPPPPPCDRAWHRWISAWHYCQPCPGIPR